MKICSDCYRKKPYAEEGSQTCNKGVCDECGEEKSVFTNYCERPNKNN